MSTNQQTIVHWYRKGLRIHDNPALIDAIKNVGNNNFLRPIFILDPLIIKWLKVGPNRWRFLQQSLKQLDDNLRLINSKLYVVRGSPENVFNRVFKEWNVSVLTFELDTEPYAKKRDETIESMAKKFDITVLKRLSNTIYDTKSIISKNNGKPPLTYQKFLSVAESLGNVSEPLSAPKEILKSCSPPPDEYEKENRACYDIPTLAELGVNENELGECLYPGGETEALKRLEKVLEKKSWICKFEKPKTSPNSLEPSTTVLSPYLKFGCLSSRLFYFKLKKIISGSSHTKPPVSLIGQLMWREFYYTASDGTPNFDKIEGNPICCQIAWDNNAEYLKAWTYGKTGYPFIDAIMRQLRQEGWIHHLARHAVACFLTRGDLWISWEEGQKVFEELLLDADWALNAGNWMWLSASAFFHQFFRVYSPVAFGKKTDKFGIYIKKYVPELKSYPSEYIYEPWNAPLSIQKQAGCIVGEHYPRRIVIHEEVYKKNITKMSLSYKKNKESQNEGSANQGNKRTKNSAEIVSTSAKKRK